MSAAAAGAADSQSKIAGLSAREVELAIVAWRAIDSGDTAVKFDYNKLAELGGFKNANSARATFNALKKKLLEGNTGGEASPSADKENASLSTKKTPRGRKRDKGTLNAGTTDDDNAGDNGDDDETPTKKPRKTPVKKGKATTAAAEELGIEDAV